MPDSTPSVHSDTPNIMVRDPRGLVVVTVDFLREKAGVIADPRVHRQFFDDAGRLISIQDPRLGMASKGPALLTLNLINHPSVSGAVIYSRNADAGWRVSLAGSAGEPRMLWDGRGHVISQLYDEGLRLSSVTEQALGGVARVVERLAYGGADEHRSNLCGRLKRHDDAAGTLLLSDYDLLASPVNETRRFLRELDDPDWPSDLDARDGLLETEGALTYRTANALGEAAQLIDAQLNSRNFEYDVAGHLARVSLRLPGAEPMVLLNQISFNACDQIVQETAGNGMVTAARFCPQDGRLSHLESGFPGNVAVQSLNWRYDPVGNVTSIEDSAAPSLFFRNQQIDHTNTYRYDSLYQLVEATGFESIPAQGWQALVDQYPGAADPGHLANYQERYEYDAAGNLQSLRHSGSQSFTRQTITSASSNRSLQVQGEWLPGEREIAEGFDANGNQRELIRGQLLEWDVRNRLRQVTPVIRESGCSDNERYIYDGAGKRVRKVQLTQGRRQVRRREVRYLPGLELRTDSTRNRAWHTINIQAGRNRVFWTLFTCGAPDSDRGTFGRFSLTDHQGSATLEFDENGTLLSQEHYYPYGGTASWAQVATAAASLKTRRYSGKELDASGLYDYGLRYYAPGLGRWINPDPGGDIDGLNRYRFVRNNPVTMSDPDGRAPDVVLLYGFENARNEYYRSLAEAPAGAINYSLTRINILNSAIELTSEDLKSNYSNVMASLKRGDLVDDDTVWAFMESEHHIFKGSFTQAQGLLNSWSGFLKAHIGELDIQKKLSHYKDDDRASKVSGFWRKNLNKAGWRDEDSGLYSRLVIASPALVFGSKEAEAQLAKQAITSWIFRRVSKLGLDWVASTSVGKPDGVLFLDLSAKDPNNLKGGWQQMTEHQYTTQPYKQALPGTLAYEPITFSERRHLQRNKNDIRKHTHLLRP